MIEIFKQFMHIFHYVGVWLLILSLISFIIRLFTKDKKEREFPLFSVPNAIISAIYISLYILSLNY